MKATTHKQLRAICPICFKQHALKGTRLVDHGYTIPQDWHQRVTSCGGVNRPHFGTLEGRAVTLSYIDLVQDYIATQQKELVAKVTSLTVHESSKRDAPMITITKKDPRFEAAFSARWQRIQSSISNAKAEVEYLTKKCDSWKPVAPVGVEVETQVPTVHFKAKTYGTIAPYCCGSATGAHRAWRSILTEKRDEVTCTRCNKQLTARDERIARVSSMQSKAV